MTVHEVIEGENNAVMLHVRGHLLPHLFLITYLI